jgi:molybdopterin-guanine dinucleotide biosynthesis protein B
VEGYKSADIPKIEVHRPSTGNPLLHPRDPNILAVASDEPITATITVLDLNDLDGIVEFIMRQRGLQIEARPRSAIVESR